MPEVAFVSSRAQPESLRELTRTIAFELERQAVDPTHHLDGFPPVRPDRVYVLADPPSYIDAEGEEALPADAVLRRTVLLWTSPPPDAEDEARLSLLRRAGSVFVLDQRAVVLMHRIGIQARLLRPGYSTLLDRYAGSARRDIDLLVLGARTERRVAVLDRARDVLMRHRTVIELNDPARMGDEEVDRRWELLTSAKVVMNIHGDGNFRLEWREVLDAVHAGAAVVSEHASGIAPLDVGSHLLMASPDALPYVAECLVRDVERRERQRRAAYERLRDWIPFALPVSVLRAAVVELVGEPSPSDAWLGSPRGASRIAAG